MTDTPPPSRLRQPIATPTGSWSHLKGLDLSGTEAMPVPELQDVPNNLTITPFSSLDEKQRTLVKRRLATLLPADPITDALAAHPDDGILVHVTGAVFRPVILDHALDGKRHGRTLLILEPGAQARIVERFHGDVSLVVHATEAFLGANSHLVYGETQAVSGSVACHRAAELREDASVVWCSVDANRETTYGRIVTGLRGINASARTHALSLGDATARMDTGTEMRHHGERGESRIVSRSVLDGDAKRIFEGLISIGPEAAKSEAFQEDHALLLSDGAEAKASPQLFIGNNDVKCSHAATTSKADEEKRFYLRSRGLDAREAQRLLITAFAWPVIASLPEHARDIMAPFAKRLVDRYVRAEELQ